MQGSARRLGLRGTLGERSIRTNGVMSTTQPPASLTTQPSSRSALLVSSVLLCLLVAACTGESTASTSTRETAQPSTTATTSRATTTTSLQPDLFADHVATIEAMVASRNSGDFDAWRSHFISDDPSIFGSVRREESDLDWQRSFMAANEVWTIDGDCRELAGDRVACPFTLRNEFHGPAGLWFEVPELTFSFADDGLIGSLGANSWEIAGDLGDYNSAFDAWLGETHPDVHANFGPRVEGEDGLPSADDMPVALQYVDEFVAQSDKYPLGEAAAAEDLAPVVEALGRGTFVSEVSGELASLLDGAQSIGSEFDDASDIVFAKITIPAGGEAPWHTHAGPALLVNVGPGTLSSALTGACVVQEVVPGTAFLDPGNGTLHAAVNNSDEVVVLYVAFLGVVENPVVGADHPDGCDL